MLGWESIEDSSESHWDNYLIQQFNYWELDSLASMLSLLYYSMPHRHINCSGVWEVMGCFECESIEDAAEDFFLRLLCEWSTVMGLNDSDILTELPIQFFFFCNFFIAIHYATLCNISFLRWLLLTKKSLW